MANTNILSVSFKQALDQLEQKLNGHNTQSVLLDLSTLAKGSKSFQSNWTDTISQMLWSVHHIIPSDEAFIQCNADGDTDGMDLINHDGDFSFFVYGDDFNGNSAPVSEHDAKQAIEYVKSHLDTANSLVQSF